MLNQLLASSTTAEEVKTQKVTQLESKDSSNSSSGSQNSGLTLDDIVWMMQTSKKLNQASTQTSDTSSESEGTTKKGNLSSIDADNDGTISADEYDALIAQLGITDAATAEEFFAQYDTNEDGEITSAEMDVKDSNRPMMPPPPKPEEALQEEQGLTSDIDTDGDGSLSADEYESLISLLNIDNAASTDEVFSAYDTNQDGEISADEIAAMKEDTEQSHNMELTSLAANTLQAYENNYMYMFDEEEYNNLDSIA